MAQNLTLMAFSGKLSQYQSNNQINLNQFMLLNYLQIVISILMIVAILLQQRGTGLSSAFGGEGGIYRTKRGIEKSLHIFTIILAGCFLLIALLNIIY